MAEVDVFSPFRTRAEGHEDRLTWAFLVTLRYIPHLQRGLREMVLRSIPQGHWEPDPDWRPVRVSTQASRLGPDVTFVVSVLLSDDSLPEPIGVQGADRSARYDGVLEFSDGLGIIIENKPRRAHVWEGQLSPSLDSFEDPEEITLYERVISLEWAEVVEGVMKHAASHLANDTERMLGADFISFVEAVHPTLSPYRTFELCRDRTEALRRRTKRLLETMGHRLDLEVGVRPRGDPYLNLPTRAVRHLQIGVHPDPEEGQMVLQMRIWPGDTANQARPFFRGVDPDAFLALGSEGWSITPNLHFSHIQQHRVWAHTPLGVSDYLDHYLAHPGEIGKKVFQDQSLHDLIEYWLDRDLISDPDAESLRRKFGDKGLAFLVVVPGFGLSRDWPMEAVIALEEEGQLEKGLLQALQAPFASWGEAIPPWPSD